MAKMDIVEKLEILADAAKYDVACTSSGVNRSGKKGQLGAASGAGCCHSFTPDGRCITLLKVLMSNACIYDCAYCVNRRSNNGPRATFTARELADLTISFYRRNYIEGLFLSSGVVKSPDHTAELMYQTLLILREEYGFRGYIHCKAIPGASPELIERIGLLADRMSVNMELPSQRSLDYLAPDKSKQDILSPMRLISENIAQDKETRALARSSFAGKRQRALAMKERAFVPAGQSTQLIIGATPESDFHILNLSAALYKKMGLKRVFFSAYLPVNSDERLPVSDAVQLNREHRLYQADWLMRFYGFNVDEVIDQSNPWLRTDVDPKANWALNNLDMFPLEINTASIEELMRVPGIGPTGARKIAKARKHCNLAEEDLRKMGIAYKRARYFITCNGKYAGKGVDFSPDGLLACLSAPIDGGRHGRRSARVAEGQLSLFDASLLDMSQTATPALERERNDSRQRIYLPEEHKTPRQLEEATQASLAWMSGALMPSSRAQRGAQAQQSCLASADRAERATSEAHRVGSFGWQQQLEQYSSMAR